MLSAGVAATGPGVAVAVDLLDLGVVEAWGLDRAVLGTSVIAASGVANNVFGLTAPTRDSETPLPPLLQEQAHTLGCA